MHTDRASSALSSEMQFNLNQQREGGHKNHLKKLDLRALDTVSVQQQLNEIEEDSTLKESLGISSAGGKFEIEQRDGAGQGRNFQSVDQADEPKSTDQAENTGMLKSFLTDAKHSQNATNCQRDMPQLSQEKYDRLRKQAQLELSRDDDSDPDDQYLLDFHRGKAGLQDSETAPEPRPFPMDYE